MEMIFSRLEERLLHSQRLRYHCRRSSFRELLQFSARACVEFSRCGSLLSWKVTLFDAYLAGSGPSSCANSSSASASSWPALSLPVGWVCSSVSPLGGGLR